MKNVYTDAPNLHPNLILGSLHLFFWLFFHPSAWRNFIIRIDPTLQPDFTLIELSRAQWRSPALRRLLGQAYLILPLLVVGLPVGLILWTEDAPLESMVVPIAYVVAISLTLGLMLGAVISVASGVASGVLVGLAAGVVATVTNGFVEGVAVPTAISIAIGAGAGIASSLASQRSTPSSSRQISTTPLQTPKLQASKMQTQIGGIVIGVLVGVVVVFLVRLGLTTLASLTIGLTEDIGYNLARTIVVGGSFGVAIGWRRGIVAGVAGGLVVSLAYAITIIAWKNNWSGLAIGLTSGVLFGTSFSVTVVLPYVLSERIAGAWAGGWAGALGSWGRHVFRNNAPLWPTLPLGFLGIFLGLTLAWWRPVLLYPLLAAWNLGLHHLDKRRVGHGPSLLRWHSAFWDEFQRLPLSGLDDHLLMVIERNPDEGQAAMDYLSTGPQRWAAQAVQIELEARRLEGCQRITAISQVHRGLVSSELAGPANALLRHFNHLSQDVEAALNQTTAYHRRLALSTIDDRLNNLIRELTLSSESYAARFYPIATHWHQVVADYVDELAEAVEQSQEIDNPYIVGVPLTEQQEIFVGRADIVARIEQLLLDRRRPPLLLYGQRRMGKTSLLRNLGRLLPRTIVPLFVDGQKTALASDYPDFLYNLAAEMRKSAEQQRSLSLPTMSRDVLAANPFTGFNEWLDKVEQILDAQGNNIALLTLDEFEMLDNVLDKGRFDETDVLSMLRHIIQHRPHFKVMLAGSHPLEEFQRWASYLINVQVVKIGYLEKDEARQLIEQPVQNFALAYEPEACQRVLELTRGHPALVQLLCYEIVALKNEHPPAETGRTMEEARSLVRPDDVEMAVSRALESGSFFFADIQHNQVDGAGLALLRFIAAQGEGAVVRREILAHHQPDELDQTLTLLLQRDLIEAVDGGYRFQVELIRRWFESVNQ
jgi:hypothetical protein